MRFFTSDLHLFHANIIRYCNRPYADADEMNEALIVNWNSLVKPSDITYVLGDVFFCPAPQAKTIMNRLNGEKYLVMGNHDKVIRKNPDVRAMFSQVLLPLHEENIDGHLTVMCHYPLLTWNKSHHGSFMLHGHTHGHIKFDNRYRRLDVGVDTNNYFPYSWTTIKSMLEAVPLPSSDHHGNKR